MYRRYAMTLNVDEIIAGLSTQRDVSMCLHTTAPIIQTYTRPPQHTADKNANKHDSYIYQLRSQASKQQSFPSIPTMLNNNNQNETLETLFLFCGFSFE